MKPSQFPPLEVTYMCYTLKHDTLTFTVAIHIAMFVMFYFHRFSVSIKLPMLTIRNNANRKYVFLNHILSYANISNFHNVLFPKTDTQSNYHNHLFTTFKWL